MADRESGLGPEVIQDGLPRGSQARGGSLRRGSDGPQEAGVKALEDLRDPEDGGVGRRKTGRRLPPREYSKLRRTERSNSKRSG